MTTNALDVIDPHDQRRLAYLTAVRRAWSTDVFCQLRDEYAAVDDDVSDPPARLARCPSLGWFGFLERGAQVLKWRVINDIVERNWPTLSAGIDRGETARAELDPELELPDWYRDCDIHCQPGGVWGDRASAVVYELGTQVLHIGRNRGLELHRRFVAAAMPEDRYGRIVDLGCGFGKSTRPIKERFADAEVIGVELSAPCVELAASRAGDDGLDIRFRQADATATGLESGSADVVTGTMVLHEMPTDALRATFAETARILAPGGIARFLEFARTGDRFRDAVMDDHAWRNNEPFLPGLMDLDVATELGRLGLTDVRWVPFDERSGELLDRYPDRDEWHFPWAVLEARKPEVQQ